METPSQRQSTSIKVKQFCQSTHSYDGMGGHGIGRGEATQGLAELRQNTVPILMDISGRLGETCGNIQRKARIGKALVLAPIHGRPPWKTSTGNLHERCQRMQWKHFTLAEHDVSEAETHLN
uniref:Uncharacterized protein n=1 Tax=Craspedostauros australis TaxID=1486917 RepID=A0A7R9ZM37_9STRA|mmetsp:Transcript_20166/g.56193  ORF Transcript_20166/g.56193 Transcript_20166/m.56193 type:complete len:122 (+) Transcript_20166:158-523(+)